MDVDLSKQDMHLMLDIIHASLSCRCDTDFQGLIDMTKSLLEFSHLRSVFGDCGQYDTMKMGAFRMLTAFPEEWEARYSGKDYFLYDNIALTAFRRPGLIYWADCAELADVDEARNEKSRNIMAEAASIGLKDGWLFSMTGQRSTQCAVLSLAGDNCEKCDRSRAILEYLSPHLCQAIKSVVLAERKTAARLTPRECEVLSWTAAGKTAWEASQIMKISRRTVEFHMGNILNKLDAVNSQQAIAIALSSGMITF